MMLEVPVDINTITLLLTTLISVCSTYNKHVIRQTESLYVLPSNSGASWEGLFGHSVDIYSNFMIVGCPYRGEYSKRSESGSRSGSRRKRSGSGSGYRRSISELGSRRNKSGSRTGSRRNGSAFMYTFNGTMWNSGIRLISDAGDQWDGFGLSVAVSVMFTVVGAPYDDENGVDAGAIYVYLFDGWRWMTDAVKLIAEDGRSGDRFGYVVDMYMDTIVVGSPYSQEHRQVGSRAGASTGSIYVFAYDGSKWIQQAKIQPDSMFNVKNFGTTVAIHGEYIITGAEHINTTIVDTGIIFVYRYNGEAWLLETTISPLNRIRPDDFGNTVDISHRRIVVGSPSENNSTGVVYVYHKEDNGWMLEEKIKPLVSTKNKLFTGERFGNSVAIDDDFIVIGSSQISHKTNMPGCFYVYRFIYDRWVLVKKLIKSADKPVYDLGSPVAMIDGKVVVGSVNDTSNGRGAAYLFNIYD